MKIGVAKEVFERETRVALVPSSVKKLVESGHEVVIEQSAGLKAGYPDDQYKQAGAHIVSDANTVFKDAEIILTIHAPNQEQSELLSKKHTAIGLLEPLFYPQQIEALSKTGATLFSMELMPRITRAQSMDVLSSMATVAGYQSVLLAAEKLAKFFPMLMTAAGTITPAKVFILGAGVIGLQAIATAKRLGAVVQAYDVRDVVKEQVESLGASFVVLDIETHETESKGGYAKAQSDAFYQKQRELLTEYLAASDVVITTALVPGKKAPILVTKEMVAAMKPGSILVDTAAEKGGNCELTKIDQDVLTDNNVLILGPGNLPAQKAYHASQMVSNNMTNFLMHLFNEQGEFVIDLDDEITSGTLVARDGKIIHPMVKDIVAKENK